VKLTNILIELIEEGKITDKNLIGYIYEQQEELEEGAKEKFKNFVFASIIAAGLGGFATNFLQQRAADNIDPHSYNITKFDKETGEAIEIGFFQRFKSTILDNEQEELRAALDTSDIGKYDKEKFELWAMYLRRDIKPTSIVPTNLKPKDAKDAEWYKVPKLEKDLKQKIGNHLNSCSSYQEFKVRFLQLINEGIIPGNAGIDTTNSKATVSIQPLGNATLAAGFEGDKFFISYYDSWDINPFKGGNAIDPYSLGKIPGDIITKLGIDKMEDISLGVNKPIKVYGRIYFSKKGNFVKSVRNQDNKTRNRTADNLKEKKYI